MLGFFVEMRDLSEVLVAKAVALVDSGKSYGRVANSLGVSKSVVFRVVKRYRERDTYKRSPGQGRKRATTTRDDRFLALTALRNRFIRITGVRRELQRARNVTVSRQTVSRRLREQQITSRRANRVPKLTVRHKVQRLRYAEKYRRWARRHWRKVLFTDECRICLQSDDKRVHVLRRPGERYAQCNMVGTMLFGGGSIMVWGGICLGGRTVLHVVEGGSLNAERYITDILEPIVIPFRPFIGDGFILMHDNARPHVAATVSNFLREAEIEVLEHPACSPDMNPIEHVWDYLKVAVRERKPPPITLAELKRAVLEEWDRIPQNTIDNVIRSMPRRLNTLSSVRGGSTRY